MNAQTEIKADHKNIHVALAVAQAKMAPLRRDEDNQHFKKKYATLAAVVEASRPALTENGISYHYEIRRADNALDMVTVFTHGSSETSIECLVPLIVDRQNMQGMKSATTYAKRIGHESLSGLAPEDDDGNEAAKNPPVHSEPRMVSPDQYIKLRDRAQEAGANIPGLLKHYGAKSLDQFPLGRFADAMTALNKKIEENNTAAPANPDLDGDEIPHGGPTQ